MDLRRHDHPGEASVPTNQVPVDGPPPLYAPPLLDAPPLPAAGPDVAAATKPPPATPSRPRRRTRSAWLVGAGATCLVVIAVVLGVRSWDLDGQVSDLTEENGTLTAENLSLDGKVSELTAERDSIRNIFPITQESLAGADLEGTYEFLFVPVEGKCTYSDCDEIGSTRYSLSIRRTSDGYALALEGVPGPPAPMSREGDVYSTSGVLPESMWGTCGDAPAETSFELHLAVAAVGLSGSDLRAVEASGTYRQYTPDAGLGCGSSESASTFTALRTG
jgi:hypothetical protein